MVQKMRTIGEHIVIFVTQLVTKATVLLAKSTLKYSFRRRGDEFFLYYEYLISMTRRSFWQSLKKILLVGFKDIQKQKPTQRRMIF